MKTKTCLCLCLCLVFAITAPAQSLTLLWESSTFRGTSAFQNSAQSVDALRNRILVGEILESTTAVVKAFNRVGHLIWTDELLGGWVQVKVVGNLAIAVVEQITPPPNGIGRNTFSLVLRAYNLRTGEPLWTARTSLDSPQRVLVRNGRIAVVGYSQSTDPLTGVILVHDLATGAPLWRVDDIQPYVIPLRDTVFWDLDEAGHNLIVVGTIGPGVARDLHIRSYRFTDGHLRWEKIVPSTFAVTVRVFDRIAYITGLSGTSGAGYLAAFAIGDGTPVWELITPNEFFTSLAVTASQVITSGPFSIRAYDTTTHALLWSRLTPFGGPTEEFTFRVLPLGNSLFLTISLLSPSPIGPPSPSQTVLRVLDNSGNTLTEVAGLFSIGVRDAVLLNDRLVVVGSSTAGALVRAYEIGIVP